MILQLTPTNYSLPKTITSGQVFLYDSFENNTRFHLVSRDNVCDVWQPSEFGEVYLETAENEVDYWSRYLGIIDNDKYSDGFLNLMHSTKELSKVYEYSRGIRILRQDVWETLVGFIVSQRNNIPRIRKCMTMIRDTLGTPITLSDTRFPTPQRIAPLSLRACSLGYREGYVYSAANAVLTGEFPLERLEQDSSYTRKYGMQELLRLQGVGTKVASCIALFGLGDPYAFPVDVWMERAIRSGIVDSDYKNAYGEYAGLVQQHVFYYMLNKR